MAQYAFLINSDACSGCKTCQVTCKDKHDLPVGVFWRKVYEVVSGEWTKKESAWISTVAAYNLSTACHHCLNPVCIPPCPVDAIWKTDNGIVLIDESSCRNCKACEMACPYGAIRFDPIRNTTTKCTFCADLLELGAPPACVAACPNRALDYGDFADLRKRYPGAVSHVFPLPDTSSTEPAVLILPHRHAGQMQSAKVANLEEV